MNILNKRPLNKLKKYLTDNIDGLDADIKAVAHIPLIDLYTDYLINEKPICGGVNIKEMCKKYRALEPEMREKLLCALWSIDYHDEHSTVKSFKYIVDNCLKKVVL